MKFVFLNILFFFFFFNSYSNVLKTYSGELTNDGKYGQHGIVTYKYYEDSVTHEFIKNGDFKYTFTGIGEYKGYTQIITGRYKNNLKEGKWTYSIVKNDYQESMNENKFYSGFISMTSNYINGYADGNWLYVSSSKFRSKINKYPSFIWSEFSKANIDTINANFAQNLVIGKLHVFDNSRNFYGTAYFDKFSMCSNNWRIQDNIIDAINEITFNSGFKSQVIKRKVSTQEVNDNSDNSSQFKTYLNYLNLIDSDTEKQYYKVDTISTINSQYYFNDYFDMLLDNEFFLYKSIGGDFAYENKFKGSYEILFKKFVSINSISGFVENYKNYYTEDIAYNQFKTSSYKVDDIIPKEQSIVYDFIKKMDNKNRLGIIQGFNAARFNNDTLKMFELWSNSYLRFDQLNKEDQQIVNNVGLYMKDIIAKSIKFSNKVIYLFDLLTKTYYQNLESNGVVKSYSNYGNWGAKSKTNDNSKLDCFILKEIFIEKVCNSRSSERGYSKVYIPISDSLLFYTKLINCVNDTSLYKSSAYNFVDNYFMLFNSLDYSHKDLQKCSFSFRHSEIKMNDFKIDMERTDLLSISKVYLENIFYGDINEKLIRLNEVESQIMKLNLQL
jgi:hypothetical protein